MQLIEIINKEKWNGFISREEHAQFLQSWQWGEFQRSLGRKVWRFFIGHVGAIQIIKYPLPLGKSYLYAPRGPVFTGSINIMDIINHLKPLAKKEKVVHLVIEPLKELNIELIKTKHIQPQDTLILDLSKKEEDLLKEMHQKTRYNIRLAEKKGVEIIEEDNIEKFWELMAQTSARDDFGAHPKAYYRKQIEILGPDASMKVLSAKYNGKIIASNIISFFGDTATYVHGASSNEYRNVMAPYLLQWHAIKLAKELGYKYYDLWGIAPSDAPKGHSWSGITRFKRGFGGIEVNYPGTLVFPLNKAWYFAYRMIKRIRK